MADVLAQVGSTEVPQPRVTEPAPAAVPEVSRAWPAEPPGPGAGEFWDVRICAWRRLEV